MMFSKPLIRVLTSLLILDLMTNTHVTGSLWNSTNCSVHQKETLNTLDINTCQQSIKAINKTFACTFHLTVPAGKMIGMTVCYCKSTQITIRQYVAGKDKQPDSESYSCSTLEPREIHIASSEAVLLLQFAEVYTVDFNITAVSNGDKPAFVATYFSPSAGYLQPSLPLEKLFTFRDCMTLTAPSGQVIFVSRLHSKAMGSLKHFVGQCARHRHVISVYIYNSHFRWTMSDNNTISLSYSFRNTEAIATPMYLLIKLAFSFHWNISKPVQTGGKWNCSTSVWPELYRHFPCDLNPQCAGAEDETVCDYAWQPRVSLRFELGRLTPHRGTSGNVQDLRMNCKKKGAEIMTFPHPQEWTDFVEAFLHILFSYRTLWIDIQPTRCFTKNTPNSYKNRMYAQTWQWRGGAVAYFIHYTLQLVGATHAMVVPLSGRSSARSRYTIKGKAWRDVWMKSLQNQGSLLEVCEVSRSLDRPDTDQIVTSAADHNITASPVPLVTCPLLHLMQESLACDRHSLCFDKRNNRGLSHTTTMCGFSSTKTTPYFTCQTNGDHVSYSFVCDWNKDCEDSSDEMQCHFPPCREKMFNCKNGQCLLLNQVCDGIYDCTNSLDEMECPEKNLMIYSTTEPPALVNLDGAGHFTVDPLPHGTTQCPPTHYKCPGDGYCLPVYTRCNDMKDCPGHEDEAGCDTYTCEGFYRCRGQDRRICLHVQHLCDGVGQCPQKDDELMCPDNTCPDQCVCFSNNIARPEPLLRLRYLNARGTGLTLNSIINYTMLIHLDVGACGWRNLSEITLPNLRVLDLSDNLLHDLRFTHFTLLKNLKELILSGNQLSSSLAGLNSGDRLRSVVLLNMSRVPNQLFNLQIFSELMPNIKILDLSYSGLESLEGTSLFPALQMLNLKGCPISDFSPDFMKVMDGLQQVIGDNFKLCCSVVLPDSFTGKCLAPVDEISSCENLLRSTFYEIIIFLFVIFALLGNLSSFIYRLKLFYLGKNKVGFAVFVIHLCVSDFVMGLYLLMIGTANRFYAGVYLYKEVTWRHSATCSIAGFLSLLSCEVSSLFICLITLDRFLVIHFPFSRLRFGVTSAHIACAVTWGLGVILASIPLLPVTSHWAFYSQSGICIPLPVTRTYFPGQHYSFSVMIVINLVMFLLIATGQGLIYWSVKDSTMSDDGLKDKDKNRSKEVTIARRLLVIAMSDFLCWFPIGVCGLLAKLDVPVPGEVNAAMATIVLPFNAALNPFLYTYTALQQKQKKDKENDLRAFINAQVKKEVGNVVSRELQKHSVSEIRQHSQHRQ